MNTNSSFRLKAILAFLAVYLVWGSTYLAIRFALETLPAFTMAGVRFLVAGGLMLLWALARKAPMPTRSQWGTTALLGFLLLFCGNGAVVWAEYQIPSGLAALLVATEPLFVALLLAAWPGDARPRFRTFVALAVGFLGTALLATSGSEMGGALHLPSVLVILGACISWAFGSLYSRRAPLPASPVVSAGLQMLHGGIYLFAFGLLMGEGSTVNPSAWSQRSLLALAYLTVFGSIVAFSSFAWLVRNVRPTLVATYAYVNPIVAIFLGWLLASEPVGPSTFVAAGLILAAVVFVGMDRPKSKGEEGEQVALEGQDPVAEQEAQARIEAPSLDPSPKTSTQRCA